VGEFLSTTFVLDTQRVPYFVEQDVHPYLRVNQFRTDDDSNGVVLGVNGATT
jgi:hypothetical protein